MARAVGWPRYMKAKRLAGGSTAFYWAPQERDRRAGFTLGPEALGTDYAAACERATMLNAHLDAWRAGRDMPAGAHGDARIGTVDWWHHVYFRSGAFTRLSSRSQNDYRAHLTTLADIETRLKDEATGAPVRFGALPVSSLSPAAVDKIYAHLRQGGRVTRQADYAIDVARRAWKVVSRQHPGLFLVPIAGADGRPAPMAINPWAGIERERRDRDTAIPAKRAEALAFARAAEAAGHPAIGVAALICFEWLQRPEDVRGGRITWTDYRPQARPAEALVIHHKTGRSVWQPLSDEATGRSLYPELEEMLERLPRLGVPIVMLAARRGLPRLYSASYAQHLVQRIRAAAGLPAHFTLEACRHGGMTELGDCGLSEQEVMSLSGHVTPAAARLYVKRTAAQRKAAAVKRRAYVEEQTQPRSGNDAPPRVGTGRAKNG